MLLTFFNLLAAPSPPAPAVLGAFDYAALELKAAALINKFGRAAILRLITKTPIDTAKPWQGTTDTKTDTTITAVFLDYSLEDAEGSLVHRSDQKVFMRGNLGIDVTDQDKIVDGTSEWAIVDVFPLNPGGVTLLFELQLRQ